MNGKRGNKGKANSAKAARDLGPIVNIADGVPGPGPLYQGHRGSDGPELIGFGSPPDIPPPVTYGKVSPSWVPCRREGDVWYIGDVGLD